MGKATDHRARFGRNFRLLALGTGASRIAGFARELATAAFVGGMVQLGVLVLVVRSSGYRRSHHMSWALDHGLQRCVAGCFKILFAAIVTGVMLTLLRDWSMGWDLPTCHLLAAAELIRLSALAPCALLLYLATVRILGVEG